MTMTIDLCAFVRDIKRKKENINKIVVQRGSKRLTSVCTSL